MLAAVLGEKPEAALGSSRSRAPLPRHWSASRPVLKAVGEETGVPTAGGTVVAGAVTLFGSQLQIAAVTMQADRLTDSKALSVLVWVMGLLTAFVVVAYGARALSGFLVQGTKAPTTAASAEVRAAWVIARALHPAQTSVELTPLELEERILAERIADIEIGAAGSGTSSSILFTQGIDGRAALL